MKKIALFAALAVFAASCEPKNEDTVKETEIQKDGSVEIRFSLSTLSDKESILKTDKTFWVKNKPVKRSTSFDTIPSLGTTKEEAEDADGETKEVVVPKNYEYYITVQ